MTFRKTKLMTVSLIGLGLAHGAFADIIQGQVTDASGESPLQGALVSIEGLDRTTSTDRFGDYRFTGVPDGDYTISVSYVGTDAVSDSVTVAGGASELNFLLGSDVRYLDNVLVVGSAAAQAGAINQQRASNSILSVIDSDGLGNFPDTTVADSLSRVPGVSIENDQGEGRYVSIRGINTDLISSSINGVRTPSPEDRRGVLLDGVPSDLLDTIEVQKSLTPDVDGDSLGGVINLKTISAFDRDGRFIRAKVEGRYNEISKDVSPKVTFTYSDTFTEQFGAAFSINYQDLAIESHNNEAGEWGIDEDSGLFFLNDDYEQRWYDLNRQRLGLVANFDFRVNESTDLYLRTLYNNYTDDEVRNKFEYRDLDDAEGGAITANSSVVPINEVDAEVRQRKELREIETYALGGQTHFDAWVFDYEVSYAYAQEDDTDNHDVTFRFEDIQDLGVGDLLFDTSTPETPRITGDALGAILDPSNYVLDVFEQEFTINEDTETSFKFDVSRDSFVGQTPVTWQVGFKYRDREKTRDANLNLYSGDQNLADFTSGFRVTDWRLPNPMPRFPDPDFTAVLRGGAGLDFETEDSAFESLSEDFTIEEQILAGYGMGTFDIGALTLVAGVRIEQTNVDSTGNIFAEGDDFDTVGVRAASKDYTNVLPSINAKYTFNEKVIGRAAYYAAAVRPAFGDSAPFVRFNDDRDELEIGNPDLDPYEADNFDLSIEYYPTKLSVISAGVFYKTIENAVYPATFDVADIPANVDLSFLTPDQLAVVEEVNTFINVDDSEIVGAEFNYVQQLDFLGGFWEGFLVSGNLTVTDSESTLPDDRTVPFLKQSDLLWNVAIGYDKGPWDLRVSANYRDDYVDELVDQDLDRFTDGRLLVEASAKYDVSDNLQIYLEGKNLTDEPEYYYFGSESRLSQYDEFGRSVILGARLTY